ncbi:hypothetical protein [Ruegeria arenilitoris]|uniref:Uncharacterized protein n=1 Tax=Ruegeria arenilitoris TaxID=1173585 RepID=A0A238K0M4_9RHOB|nr:hypothetical protein [Ruegeria arenilitoris]SMX36461.1 hypothetical protein RUA8715_01407 [Ruegeria arenilitoris]
MSDYVPTSVSIPRDLADELAEIAEKIDEPLAVIYRQIVRVGIARGWDAKRLGLDNSRESGERRIVRVALSEGMKGEADALAEDHAFGRWFKEVAKQVVALHHWGDRGVWSLLQ